MNGWLLAVAGVLAAPRPNLARVRLSTIAAERARRRTAAQAPVALWWQQIGTTAIRSALARPHRAGAAVAGMVLLGVVLTGSRLPVGGAAALVAAVIVHAVLGTVAGRRARRDDAALSDALGVLESELVAGAREDAALVAAAGLAGRSGPLLREAAAVAGYGEETALVLGRSVLLEPLASAWRVRHSCGAPLADVVAQVARDVETRRQRAAAVDSALAGPRSSSALLTGLPVIGAALGVAMGAHPGRFLFATPTGSVCLLIGVGLDVAGWLWTGAMVRRARR